MIALSEKHDQIVEELHEKYRNQEDSRWDEVYKNVDYYHKPENISLDRYGNQRGEMDVCLIDDDEQTILYIEVKTNEDDARYAKEQINRARNYWESMGWNFIGKININREMYDPDEL